MFWQINELALWRFLVWVSSNLPGMRIFVILWDDNLDIDRGPGVQRVGCPIVWVKTIWVTRSKTFHRFQLRRGFLLLAVDFSLFYYTSAEVAETKMVLPVHQATKVCLSMTSDKKLQISVSLLHNIKLLVCEWSRNLESSEKKNGPTLTCVQQDIGVMTSLKSLFYFL